MKMHPPFLILILLVAVCQSLWWQQQPSARLADRTSTEIVTENTIAPQFNSSSSFKSTVLNEIFFHDTQPSHPGSSALRRLNNRGTPRSISDKFSVDLASFNISFYEAKTVDGINVSRFVEFSERSPEETILHLIDTNSFVAMPTNAQDNVTPTECEKSENKSCERQVEKRKTFMEFQLSELSALETTRHFPVTPCLSFTNGTKGGFVKVHRSIGVAKSLELSLGLNMKLIRFSVSQNLDFRFFMAENIDFSITCEASSGETVQANVAKLSYAEFIPRYRRLVFNSTTLRLEEQEEFRALPIARILLSNPELEISCATSSLSNLDCDEGGNPIALSWAEI